MTAALEQALTHGDGRIEHDGQTHRIVVQAGAADVELLTDLKNSHSGDHYGDIDTATGVEPTTGVNMALS